MQSVLVIGAGGVSHVTVHKMASLSKIFTNIILASRTIDKCLKIKKSVKKMVLQWEEMIRHLNWQLLN